MIEQKTQELEQIRALIADVNRSTPEGQQRFEQLKQEESKLVEEIQNLQTQAQVEQNHEQRVQESQQAIATIIDSLDFGGMTLRQMFTGEDEYQSVRIKFQRILEDNDDDWSRKIKGFEERELQRDRQIDNLQIRYSDLERENSRLSAWANEQETRADDAESKRDAAGLRISELESENAQLKSWNDDLQLQISRGVSGAIRVIDAETLAKQAEEEQARIERIRAQKTIYDLKPDNDINPKNYTAKRVIDGEEVTFNWTQKNSYIVLDDPEQVLSFRIQHEAKNSLPDLPLDEPVEVTPPALEDVTQGQFREGTDDVAEPAASAEDTTGDIGQPVGGRYDQSVLVAEVATLKQTVARLEADVVTLKIRNGMVA